LSLTKKTPPKVHPAVELLSNLSSAIAVEKAASQKVETRVLEMEVKAKALVASNARAEADAMLKSREQSTSKSLSQYASIK
jgi:hypothetical protein